MHSRIVVIAPSSFCSRSSACSGVASLRSLVPRPMTRQLDLRILKYVYHNSLGQLKPSKSIGGFRVYGLAGRLVGAGIGSGASSLGSLASTSRLVELSGSSSTSSLSCFPCPFVCGPSIVSRSIGCRLVFDDLMEAVSLSRSFALIEVLARGELPCET